MKPMSLIQHPPVMILGIALVLLPVVTANGTHSNTNQIGFLSSHQVRGSSSSMAIEPRDASGASTTQAVSEEPSAQDNTFSLGLNFQLNPFRNPRSLLGESAPSAQVSSYDLDSLFKANTHSLVAKAVGSAEGTRTPSGGYTRFFQGHVDPGNGVWNLGTFSYQHGANSPEEADQKQLRRLKGQAAQIRQRAMQSGIALGLEEELNGIDLANQSPLAALGEPGYAEWLSEAYQQWLQGKEAILWARVHGYWDVRRERWNAPGLGNTEPSIRRDQSRRMEAIAQSIDHHLGQSGESPQILPSPRSDRRPLFAPEQSGNSSEETPDANFNRNPSAAGGSLTFDL